jgi:hypothetical protein
VRVKLQAEYPQTRLEQKTDMMTNNTNPNPTVIIPTFKKLAQLKPECNCSKNLDDGDRVVKDLKVNLVICVSDDMGHDKCMQVVYSSVSIYMG